MPGLLTNGYPAVNAFQNNGTVVAPVPYTNVTAASMLPLDTELGSGASPQSVAATAFQVACNALAFIQNTATSTVHTATLNTKAGLMYTESLSTAAGSDYTFQIVNSQITATGALPQVQMHFGTCLAGDIAVKNISNAAGTTTAVFTNTGTAAWNGTMIIGFHL